MKEYPTLTALMAGREPGSVKVRSPVWKHSEWIRPGKLYNENTWTTLTDSGTHNLFDDDGPWLIVSEDAPKLDTLRLEIAARVLAGLFSTQTNSLPCALHEDHGGSWDNRHAYALAEADALIKEARK